MSAAHKLRDLDHASAVSCVAVGRRSGRVMAVASPKSISVWVLGKQAAYETFTAISGAPRCICFDAREELLAVGASDGSVKICDLIQRQLARSFTAHSSAVTALAFHPHAQFFATASDSGELKLWDLKTKEALQTHKAHNGPVAFARFSPDGQWLITGAESSAKVWALAANAMLTELNCNSPITCIDFHPKQLVFAIGATDGSIRFWGLEEKPELITTITSSSPVLSIAFTSETTLAAVSKETLRVLGWSPKEEHESKIVQWGGEIGDAAIARDRAVDRLILLSIDSTRTPVWIAPLCKPGSRPVVAPAGPVVAQTAEEPQEESAAVFKPRKALKHSPVAPDKTEAAPHVSPPSRAEESPSAEDKPALRREQRDAAAAATTSTKDLDIASFLSTGNRPSVPLSEDALMEEIMQPHATMCGILSSRLTKLRVVRNFWVKSDAKGAVEAVAKMADNAVLADVLRVMMTKKDSLSTEVCTALFPLIKDLLSSQCEEYVAVGLSMFKQLIRQVALFIKSTKDLQSRGSTKDVSEKRLEQCNSCYEVISELNPLLTSLRKRTGTVGANARDLLKMPELVQFYKAK